MPQALVAAEPAFRCDRRANAQLQPETAQAHANSRLGRAAQARKTGRIWNGLLYNGRTAREAMKKLIKLIARSFGQLQITIGLGR